MDEPIHFPLPPDSGVFIVLFAGVVLGVAVLVAAHFIRTWKRRTRDEEK